MHRCDFHGGQPGAVVKLHGFSMGVREVPSLDEGGSDLGVVEPKKIVFNPVEQLSVFPGAGNRLSAEVSFFHVHHQPTYVVEQAGDEEQFLVLFTHPAVLGYLPGERPAGQGVFPEGFHIHKIFWHFVETWP